MAAFAPKHLLEQARALLSQDAKRPRQANLRRAVSASYYALFHLLIQDATRFLAPKSDPELRQLIPRAFTHEEMATACRTFASGGALPTILQAIYPGLVVPPKLAAVAQAFVDLQKARHDADYSTHLNWTRTMVLTEIERAELAMRDWQEIRPRSTKAALQAGLHPMDLQPARLFVVWLLLRRNLQAR